MQSSFFRSSIFRDYPYLLALSFFTIIITAYFSVGNHHPDEHFQILEFANSRLGGSDSGLLPWEFAQNARPTLQPSMAMGAIRFMHIIGIDNPFTIAFIIRLITGICIWAISLLMIDHFIGQLKTKNGQLYLLLTTLFLWFAPYLYVRFSSEILAGYSFLLALLCLLKFIRAEYKKTFFIVIAGLLFGFSFFFRFQMAAAILGVLAWLIVYRKLPYSDLLKLYLGGLLATLICMGIDIWFYQKLIFTPWNYLYTQLILGKAASFGTSPWWHYFTLFFTNAVPPISIVLFIFFMIGGIKKRQSVLVWIILPFVFMHMGIGHKEMRFLFPIFPVFLLITAWGFDHLLIQYKTNKSLLIVVKLTLAINILLLVYRSLAPAQELISYYRFLYNIASEQKHLLISIGSDPYDYVGLPVNFYRSPNIVTKHFSSYSLAENYFNNHSPVPTLILHNELILNYKFSNFSAERIYTIIPDWIAKYNINDWQSRADLYSIYRLEKK